MFALGQEDQVVPSGISVEEAGDIAGKNVMMMAVGIPIAFYLIYRMLGRG